MDPRSGQVRFPNTSATDVLPSRRSPYTSEELNRQVIEFVDALHDAGSLDDQSYRACDRWLGSVLRQQWDTVARKAEQDLLMICARHSQERANLHETEIAIHQTALDLRIVDHSVWLSRNFLLTEVGGTRAWEVERGPERFEIHPIFAPGLEGGDGTPVAGSSDEARLGIDYSFLITPDAPPVWKLTAPLRLVLAGPCPEGAGKVLREAVDIVRPELVVPLEIAAPRADESPTGGAAPGEIVIRYAVEAPAREGHLGHGSSASVGDFHISGEVSLLDVPQNAPHSTSALSVMLHELMHALGVGHCADGLDEVMTPTSRDRRALGRGDRAALRAIRVVWSDEGGRP